jgi:spore maturation protein CgeB
MRILFLATDYPDVLQAIYGSAQAGRDQDTGYAALAARRNETLFIRCDYLTDALRALGHDADAFYINNLPLQLAWLREAGIVDRPWISPGATVSRAVFRLRRIGSHARLLLNRVVGDGTLAPAPAAIFDTRNPLVCEIIAQQIERLRPDVVYNFDPVLVDGQFLEGLNHHYGSLVAQIASPFPDAMDWQPYDLVISSLPNFIAQFEQTGVPAAYLPLYFPPQVLKEIGEAPRDLPLSFVGSVSRVHEGRRRFLKQIAEALPLAFYGTLLGEGEATSLAKAYHGPAWGREMYEILGRSRITLNRHIDIANCYSNNLRLYEATGMGACLVTERGRNLAELFEPGREVVAYDDVEHCIDLCRYYLAHPQEAATIAAAGQQRCLADHTVGRYAERLITILRKRL